ncbi:MAG: LCP family protein [Aurantimicrobium sp.]|uniref:LCP family protein n=1 Tax=Aurantimicrobium sp. TaxID=1930784 RepID=UPI002FC58F71
MSQTSPLRYPDTSSQKVMTTRAWWLVVLNFVLPGSVQALAGNKRLGKIGLGATLVLVGFLLLTFLIGLLWPTAVFFLATWGPTLLVGQIALYVYAALWAILTLDTLRLIRVVKTGPRARWWVASVTVVAMLFISGGAAYAATLTGSLNNALGKIFVAGPSEPPVDGQYNFLLLGGDAGEDRAGLRPDTAQVVSVNAETGQATIIGMPRDLQAIPFNEDSPMYSVYPNGYTQETGEYCTRWACLNTVYVAAENDHPDLYPNAAAEGSSPGIEAMRDAAEAITGLDIQYYVLIDMQGLLNLIDALGGVEIDVQERIAIATPDVPEDEVERWVEIGNQHMDGWLAMEYMRSRWNGTGDYDRMKRQQQVQESLLRQMNPANVLSKFQEIASAGTQVVKTDIPQSMLGYFVSLGLKTKELPINHIELTPYFEPYPVDTEYPDYSGIQNYLELVIHPPTQAATP